MQDSQCEAGTNLEYSKNLTEVYLNILNEITNFWSLVQGRERSTHWCWKGFNRYRSPQSLLSGGAHIIIASYSLVTVEYHRTILQRHGSKASTRSALTAARKYVSKSLRFHLSTLYACSPASRTILERHHDHLSGGGAMMNSEGFLGDMTYEETVLRKVRLTFVSHQNRWVDLSLRNLTGDWLRRIEERFAGVNGGGQVPSTLQSFAFLDQPHVFVEEFFEKTKGRNLKLDSTQHPPFVCGLPRRSPSS